MSSEMVMASRKLFGSLDNKGTLRVLASLYEHDLNYEFIPVDVRSGENQTESFLAMSPFGELPVFIDEELTLFDSRSIMRMISYAFLKMGKEQIIEESKLAGVVAIWIDVEDHQFDPPATKLIEELVHKPKNGISTDEAVVAAQEEKLAKVLDIYEERLSESQYMGGFKFTSADLTHLPNFHYLKDTQVKRLWESRPHVNAWVMQIMARPAWIKVEEILAKADL